MDVPTVTETDGKVLFRRVLYIEMDAGLAAGYLAQNRRSLPVVFRQREVDLNLRLGLGEVAGVDDAVSSRGDERIVALLDVSAVGRRKGVDAVVGDEAPRLGVAKPRPSRLEIGHEVMNEHVRLVDLEAVDAHLALAIRRRAVLVADRRAKSKRVLRGVGECIFGSGTFPYARPVLRQCDRLVRIVDDGRAPNLVQVVLAGG